MLPAPGYRRLLLACACACVGLAAPALAAAGERDGDQPDPFAPPTIDCTALPEAPDGSHRQSFPQSDPVGGIAALPPRIVVDLQRGQSASFCVGFQNRSARPIDLDVEALDVTADDDGAPATQRDARERGASRWISLPTRRIEQLEPGQIGWLLVRVDVPQDAPPGSAYTSVLASSDASEGADGGSGVQTVPSIASQLFFDIPGAGARRGTITSIDSPRVIWWDGLGLGSLPLLDRVRGLGVASIRFTWSNTGDYSNEVGGRVAIRSDLSGRTVTTLAVPEQVVLRGSQRRFSVTWSRDIPLLGRFTPVLEVRRDEGASERHRLDPIWVVPAWWYVLALVLSVALPLRWRRRSRRRYRELLARVEAAEAAGRGDAEGAP